MGNLLPRALTEAGVLCQSFDLIERPTAPELPRRRPSRKRGRVTAPRSPDATHVHKLTEVGRYALGVVWGDGHDSILPFRNLRAACPCEPCATRANEVADERLAR